MKFKTALIITTITAIACLSSSPDYFKSKSSSPANHAASSTDLSGESAIRHLKENGDYESLGAAVEAARYAADRSEESIFAENYANNMRAEFSPEGLVLESSDPNANWRSRWRLQNLEHGSQRMAANSGEVETDGNRITIKRRVTENGTPESEDSKSRIVEEWFNNTPAGLEHGFTLRERLSESDENLRLTIVVEGDLQAQSYAGGQGLRLVNKLGEAVLNYEKLRVWDADGVEVAARMTTEEGSVVLEVEETAATYPLVIDPTFTAAAKLTANDGAANDWFGRSVAISGDTVVIGA